MHVLRRLCIINSAIRRPAANVLQVLSSFLMLLARHYRSYVCGGYVTMTNGCTT